MNIRELRKHTGLSQHKFAAKYHMSFCTLQNWEQGRRTPPEHVLYLLERVIKEIDYKDK